MIKLKGHIILYFISYLYIDIQIDSFECVKVYTVDLRHILRRNRMYNQTLFFMA